MVTFTKTRKKTEQMGIRVTPDLRKLLHQAAQKSGRSINGEATFRLECSFIDKDTYARIKSAEYEALRLSDIGEEN